ncbi:MAG: hypothetical protein AB9866_16835 [Syntrophobacteraceae bacterium]
MNGTMHKLRLKVEEGGISRFFSILQQGVFISGRPLSTLWEVLDSAGFSRKYLEERVQTLFLNGSAVDDIESEKVRGGSVIALSAAMPGLVGAIFRKGSPISALRSRTEDCSAARADLNSKELVRLKLFNTVAREMGPMILGCGAILRAPELESFLTGRRELLGNVILEAELDGESLDPERLFLGSFLHSDYVLLSVM